jgi:hypothetical protein
MDDQNKKNGSEWITKKLNTSEWITTYEVAALGMMDHQNEENQNGSSHFAGIGHT